MNWSLKSAYFRSSFNKSSSDLRKKKIFGIKQLIELKSLVFLFQYLKTTKKSLPEHFKSFCGDFWWNNRTNQLIYVGSHVSLFSTFFHHSSSKGNSLPLYLRDTSISLHTFKSRLRKHLSLVVCLSIHLILGVISLHLIYRPVKLEFFFASA